MNSRASSDDDTLTHRDRLAYAMSSYWANFAYTGAPGKGRAGDLPEWQPWSNADKGAKTLLINADNRGVHQINENLTIADLKQELRSDPSLQKDQPALCRTYLALFDKSLFGRQHFDTAEFATLGHGGCKM